jgi:ribose 1,5-bisphosphokinase PhnN
VPVRQWVLSLPIPVRLLLAAQPKLVTPVLQVVHRAITRHLLGQAGLKADEADSGEFSKAELQELAALAMQFQGLDGFRSSCAVPTRARWSRRRWA